MSVLKQYWNIGSSHDGSASATGYVGKASYQAPDTCPTDDHHVAAEDSIAT